MKFFNTLLSLFCFIITCVVAEIPHYYCIPSDKAHFHLLENLIGSIHHVDNENLGEIAVFDLGLTNKQKKRLKKMNKVTVHAVEMTHPDLLTYFHTHTNGRKVRGHFAWKPVVIKQALDLFPYVLYCDAGTTILKPLDTLFEYINEKGYFLTSCSPNQNCNIPNRITKIVMDGVVSQLTPKQQDLILSETTYMIDAGMQGVSRAMLKKYVLPMYEYTKNLELFKDDGTAPFGYGAGRHDQTLFSILAHCLGLTIHPEGAFTLTTSTRSEDVHIHWDRSELNEQTIIYRSRHDVNFNGGSAQYIRFKKGL